MTLRAQPRAARRGRPARRAPWHGRSFPLAEQRVRRVPRDQRHRQRHRHLADGLEQLFKPFSQIDSGLARKFEGTGLGLAMVKLLAELHGGTVAVESAVGEGSCFTVWLPLRGAGGAARRSRRRARAARPERAPEQRTALVVEDDFKAADLIRVQLEAEGFTVLHAATAEAALVARGAAAAVADHARHHAAEHGRLGVPQPAQAAPGLRARPGRDHLDRARIATRASRSAPRR